MPKFTLRLNCSTEYINLNKTTVVELNEDDVKRILHLSDIVKKEKICCISYWNTDHKLENCIVSYIKDSVLDSQIIHIYDDSIVFSGNARIAVVETEPLLIERIVKKFPELK